MSDYSNERGNIIKKMYDLSDKISYSKNVINARKTKIKDYEEDIIQEQKYIDDWEVELIYLMDQLKQEFQE